jgi:hypothetical protein
MEVSWSEYFLLESGGSSSSELELLCLFRDSYPPVAVRTCGNAASQYTINQRMFRKSLGRWNNPQVEEYSMRRLVSRLSKPLTPADNR